MRLLEQEILDTPCDIDLVLNENGVVADENMIPRVFGNTLVFVVIVKKNGESILYIINTSNNTIHGEQYRNNQRFSYIFYKKMANISSDLMNVIRKCKTINLFYYHIIAHVSGIKIDVTEEKELNFDIFDKIEIRLPKFANCVFYSYFYAKSIISGKELIDGFVDAKTAMIENKLKEDNLIILRKLYDFMCSFYEKDAKIMKKFDEMETKIINDKVSEKNKHFLMNLEFDTTNLKSVNVVDMKFASAHGSKKTSVSINSLKKYEETSVIDNSLENISELSVLLKLVTISQNKIINFYKSAKYDECEKHIILLREICKKNNVKQFANVNLYNIEHIMMIKKNNYTVKQLKDINFEKFGVVRQVNEVNYMYNRTLENKTINFSPFPVLSSHFFLSKEVEDFGKMITEEMIKYAGYENIQADVDKEKFINNVISEAHSKHEIATHKDNVLGFCISTSLDENSVTTHQVIKNYGKPETKTIIEHIAPIADFNEIISLLATENHNYFFDVFNDVKFKKMITVPFPSIYRNLVQNDKFNKYYKQSDYDDYIYKMLDSLDMNKKIDKIIKNMRGCLPVLDNYNKSIFVFILIGIEHYWNKTFNDFSVIKKEFVECVHDFEEYEKDDDIITHMMMKVTSAIISKKNVNDVILYLDSGLFTITEELAMMYNFLLNNISLDDMHNSDIYIQKTTANEKKYISHKVNGIEKNIFLLEEKVISYTAGRHGLTINKKKYDIEGYHNFSESFTKIHGKEHIIFDYTHGCLPFDFIKNFDFTNKSDLIIGRSPVHDFELVVKDNKIYKNDYCLISPDSIPFYGELVDYFRSTPIYFFNGSSMEITVDKTNIRLLNNKIILDGMTLSEFENNQAFKWIIFSENIFYSSPDTLLMKDDDGFEKITLAHHMNGFSNFTDKSIKAYIKNTDEYYYDDYMMRFFQLEIPNNEIISYHYGLNKIVVEDNSIYYVIFKNNFEAECDEHDLNAYYHKQIIDEDYDFDCDDNVKQSIKNISHEIINIQSGDIIKKIVYSVPKIKFIENITRKENNIMKNNTPYKTNINLCNKTRNITDSIIDDMNHIGYATTMKTYSLENYDRTPQIIGSGMRTFFSDYFNGKSEGQLKKIYDRMSIEKCHVHNSDVVLLYEINRGDFIRYNQWQLIQKMVRCLTGQKTKYYQMLMGSGKTTFIIPIVCLLLFYHHNVKQIFVVQPANLVEQTYNIFLKNVKPLLDVKIVKNVTKNDYMINVISDVDLKKYIIEKGDTDDIVVIFDEVDDLSNNLKCEMNFTKGTDVIDCLDYRIDLICEFISFAIDHCRSVKPSYCYFFDDEVIMKNGDGIINDFLKHHRRDKFDNASQKNIYEKLVTKVFKTIFIKKFNLNYGIDTTHMTKQNKYYAIPFVSAQTPSQMSQFSDVDYCIAYTYLSLQYMKNVPDYITGKFVSYYRKGDEKNLQTFTGLSPKNLKGLKMSEITRKQKIYGCKSSFEDVGTKIYFIKKIFNGGEYKYNLYAENISFMDIFSNRYFDRKVGITGTPFILPFIDLNQSVCCVKLQKGANGLISQDIISGYEVKSCEKDDLLNSITKIITDNKYLFFIDVAAYFVNYNLSELVKSFHRLLGKKIIFFKGDKVVSYDDTGINDHDSGKPTGLGDFFFFDQSHITGVDVKLCKGDKDKPVIGLVSVSYNTRFRDMAQGVYRLRSIGDGQAVKMVTYDDDVKKLKEIDFLKMLLKNEEEARKQMLNFYYPQLLRDFDRSLGNNNFRIKINDDKMNAYDLCVSNIANKNNTLMKKIMTEYENYLKNATGFTDAESIKENTNESTSENTNESTNEQIVDNIQRGSYKFEFDSPRMIVMTPVGIASTKIMYIYNDASEKKYVEKKIGYVDHCNYIGMHAYENYYLKGQPCNCDTTMDAHFIISGKEKKYKEYSLFFVNKNKKYLMTKYEFLFLYNKLKDDGFSAQDLNGVVLFGNKFDYMKNILALND